MKEQLLSLLTEQFASGEFLANRLGVSRAAVWKAVQALRKEGHKIASNRAKGYRLEDFLSIADVKSRLAPHSPFTEVLLFSCLPSTNTYLKEQGRPGQVAVALEQTAGRGRRGRSFYSSREQGLFFSVLPGAGLPAAFITLAAAVAVCKALEAFTAKPSIKWVNDIYLNGKKVAGILTEGIYELESQQLTSFVLGVGLNLRVGSFPPDVEATSLFDHCPPVSPSVLLAELLNQLHFWLWEKPENILKTYRQHCFILGKEITVSGREGVFIAHDLGEDGSLIIEKKGVLEKLQAGEISIKPLAKGGW